MVQPTITSRSTRRLPASPTTWTKSIRAGSETTDTRSPSSWRRSDMIHRESWVVLALSVLILFGAILATLLRPEPTWNGPRGKVTQNSWVDIFWVTLPLGPFHVGSGRRSVARIATNRMRTERARTTQLSRWIMSDLLHDDGDLVSVVSEPALILFVQVVGDAGSLRVERLVMVGCTIDVVVDVTHDVPDVISRGVGHGLDAIRVTGDHECSSSLLICSLTASGLWPQPCFSLRALIHALGSHLSMVSLMYA